ncbi:hypothetical protein L873DRAFT_1665993, partial [Choiromyces venosus 120613-1]
KDPFYTWSKESKEEKVKAMNDMQEWNKKAGKEEEKLNRVWGGIEEWQKLREVEPVAL